MASPFYAKGLRFSCTRCSDCCRHEPGYVYLRKSDVLLLEKKFKMEYIQLMKAYCRWIPAENGTEWLSLKEKQGFDCIFWQNGCSVYECRPIQCRSFPFWTNVLNSSKSWKDTASSCPGMNNGALHSLGVIENWLEQLREEPVIIRGGNQ